MAKHTYKYKKWSAEELDILHEKAEYLTTTQISLCLARKGCQRTPEAVGKKILQLGYPLRTTLDNYSACEVARVCGVDRKTVARWIARGWLPATQSAPNLHRIRQKDLKRFFSNPPKKRIETTIAQIDKDAIKYLVGKA